MIRRRVVTIPLVVISLWVVLVCFPALLIVGLFVDLLSPHPRSVSTTRLTVFLPCFLIVENLGLVLLAWIWITTTAGSPARSARTFAVQRLYTGWHLRSVTWIFSLTFVVKGAELVLPGPLLVFVRHASLVDVLIPGGFIANSHLLELRYVLKRELLIEPCLDVAGHWIPNHFVDRGGLDTERELAALVALKSGLRESEGVIIYPEGTRFSRRKRDALIEKLDGPRKERALKLRHVNPIRPGGALTLLGAAPSCDVLFVGHHGLEGLTRLSDIWRGSLVGRTITVQFWREKAADVPQTDEARLKWVDEKWLRLDEWLQGFE